MFLFPSAIRAEEMSVQLQSSPEGTYTIDSRFWTPAEPSAAWNTLSDYGHLPEFVRSLTVSRVQQKTTDYLLVQQEAVGRAFVVLQKHLKLLLKVREEPDRQILFEDISQHDFTSYSGSWHIERAAGGGSWITYHLQARPKFYAPRSMARKAFRKNARDLLIAIDAEIIRRGDLSKTLLCCSPAKN